MDTQFCSKCGAQINGDVSFCPSCGAPVQKESNLTSEIQKTAKAPAPEKDKLVAGLLAIFLGGFGVHYFYMDKVSAGVISLIITLCSCGIWQILMFIQGIYILTLDKETFEKKYVNSTSSFPLF